MELEKQVCSLESAKKLKELGFVQESLFYYGQQGNLMSCDKYYDFLEWVDTVGKPNNSSVEPHYSAYTVAELGELLPESIWDESYRLYVRKYKAPGIWLIDYRNRDEDSSHTDFPVETDSEAEARAKMLIYLKENNLI